jgi:D-arabinose 1-dehydrogenase-like Zn-dependent alcohol dehydrogenase
MSEGRRVTAMEQAPRSESWDARPGICHSDALVKEGHWPGIQYPRVPGHEIAGRIEAIGADVALWKRGSGSVWDGTADTAFHARMSPWRLHSAPVRKDYGDPLRGGYAEYMVVPAEAVASVPDDLHADKAAPLLCAGITVFHSLRNSGARGGDLVLRSRELTARSIGTTIATKPTTIRRRAICSA